MPKKAEPPAEVKPIEQPFFFPDVAGGVTISAKDLDEALAKAQQLPSAPPLTHGE